MSNTGNILVVDNEPHNLILLSNMLNEHGYKVRAVKTGVHALAAAQASTPDLILLDILMPEMDGYEVCRRLKANEATSQIPVIFISALDNVGDKVQAFASGGVDYVTKPFQAAEVLARVETHLTLRRLNNELQLANAELAMSVQELQARNAELDAFAHTVAHDLKSPLINVIGYAELIQEEWDTLEVEETRQYLGILAKSGQKCNRIVDELLLLAALRKQDSIPLQPLDMLAVIAEAESRLTPLIQPYPQCIVKPTALPTALGYAPWVEEIWVNYLSNGIKYGGTPPRVEVDASDDQDGMIRFWAKDNGAGIPSDRLSLLFVEFSQLDTIHRESSAQGHGLGLSIVRRITERLGGQVGVTSRVGEGSTFWFTLPAIPSNSL